MHLIFWFSIDVYAISTSINVVTLADSNFDTFAYSMAKLVKCDQAKCFIYIYSETVHNFD